MKIAEFAKGVAAFYCGYIGSMLRTLLPETKYTTFFLPTKPYTECLHINTEWMGQTIKQRDFILAHRKEREDYLRGLYEMGKISKEELEYYNQ